MLNMIVMILNMVGICDGGVFLSDLRAGRCRMFFPDRGNDERNRNDKKKFKLLHCLMSNGDDHSILWSSVSGVHWFHCMPGWSRIVISSLLLYYCPKDFHTMILSRNLFLGYILWRDEHCRGPNTQSQIPSLQILYTPVQAPTVLLQVSNTPSQISFFKK